MKHLWATTQHHTFLFEDLSHPNGGYYVHRYDERYYLSEQESSHWDQHATECACGKGTDISQPK